MTSRGPQANTLVDGAGRISQESEEGREAVATYLAPVWIVVMFRRQHKVVYEDTETCLEDT